MIVCAHKLQISYLIHSILSCVIYSSGFTLSPDFRQRAPSNASSVGRLSPIPSVVDLEPSWNTQYQQLSQDFDGNSLGCNNNLQGTTDGAIQINQCATLDGLAVSIDDLNIQNDFMQGYAFQHNNLNIARR